MKKIFVICIIGLLVLVSGCVQEDQGDVSEVESEMSFIEFRVTDKVTEELTM